MRVEHLSLRGLGYNPAEVLGLEGENEEIRDSGRGHKEKMTTRKEVEKKRKGG